MFLRKFKKKKELEMFEAIALSHVSLFKRLEVGDFFIYRSSSNNGKDNVKDEVVIVSELNYNVETRENGMVWLELKWYYILKDKKRIYKQDQTRLILLRGKR